ncbi:unnamed protein product [Brassica oleracea]
MANSFIILVDVKAKCCSNSAEVRFAECLKHQRKWKSVPSYTKSWYDRGLEIYQAEKYRKGARKTGSVSASGMLYTGVKKLETVMVDAVCFSTFTSLLIIQS